MNLCEYAHSKCDYADDNCYDTHDKKIKDCYKYKQLKREEKEKEDETR